MTGCQQDVVDELDVVYLLALALGLDLDGIPVAREDVASDQSIGGRSAELDAEVGAPRDDVVT